MKANNPPTKHAFIAVSLFWFNLIRAFNSGFNCLIELNQSKKLDWINEIKASQIELSPKLNQKRQIETLILNYSLFPLRGGAFEALIKNKSNWIQIRNWISLFILFSLIQTSFQTNQQSIPVSFQLLNLMIEDIQSTNEISWIQAGNWLVWFKFEIL